MSDLPLEIVHKIMDIVFELHRADAIQRYNDNHPFRDIGAWRCICEDLRTNVPRYYVLSVSEQLPISIFSPDCCPQLLNTTMYTYRRRALSV